jgi:hypothetical protein
LNQSKLRKMQFGYEEKLMDRFASLEEFSKHLSRVSLTEQWITPPPTSETCIICSEIPGIGFGKLRRRCQCESYPCEGHTCDCIDKFICTDCLISHLWKSSNGRDIGRFRAKCPFCQAEYCHNDLVRMIVKPSKSKSQKKLEKK